MRLTINGEEHSVPDGMTVGRLVEHLGLRPERLAVEVNRRIVRRPNWPAAELHDNDVVEIVHFVGGGQSVFQGKRGQMSDTFVIAGHEFRSRLIIGTGKYRNYQEMVEAHEKSGAEVVTVAVRRVNLTDRSQESLLDHIDPKRFRLLPNTAGCYTAEEAVRTALLAREVLDTPWLKLEVIGDQTTLFPDNEATLEAARVLVKEGFIVLPYFNDDLIMARKLIDAGCAAVMPLAAPIGSGMGVQNPANLRIMREQITQVPIIVDAGVGTASDAAIAMELGVDGLLLNTAVAAARDPGQMATAMRLAVEAGRLAYLAGRMPRKLYASASSPVEGVVR